MKLKNSDWDREKKVKVLKGTDKINKHRNSIYNMLSEEDDFDFRSDDSEMLHNYDHYVKQR